MRIYNININICSIEINEYAKTKIWDDNEMLKMLNKLMTTYS